MNTENFNNQINSITDTLSQTYNNIQDTPQKFTSLLSSPLISDVKSLKTPTPSILKTISEVVSPSNNEISSPSQSLSINDMYNPTNTLTQETTKSIISYDLFSSGWFYFIVLLILSFLGINVFYILSKGSEMVGDVGSGFIGYIKGLFLWIIIQIKSLFKLTGEGTKVGVDVVSGTAQSSLGLLEKAIEQPRNNEDEISRNKPTDTISSGLDIPGPNIIQKTKELIGGNIKNSGYCYVGTNNSVGSCAYVDRDDMCTSKRIYPTMELCINRENVR